MRKTQLPTLFGLLVLASCQAPPPPAALTGAPVAPVALTPGGSMPPATRISGPVSGPAAMPNRSASYGTPATTQANSTGAQAEGQGDISFDFADTDIRAVVAQVLGNILHVNYTIDPGVTGTVTLHTVVPLTQDQVLPTLQTLLAQTGAVLVQTDGLYRVMPAGQGGGAAADTQVIPLRYADATQLASVLQPYVAKNGTLAADAGSNSIVIQGEPAARAALAGLVQAFDVDALAGQSYELFPVTSGNAKDFATAFTSALGKQTDSKGAAAVTVVPLDRISAVLVIARAQSYLNDAARIYAVINRVQSETLRNWRVFYLHNSQANDDAYLLQEAFTPDNVTAQPTPAATQSDTSSFNDDNSAGSSSGTRQPGTDSQESTAATSSVTSAQWRWACQHGERKWRHQRRRRKHGQRQRAARPADRQHRQCQHRRHADHSGYAK